MIAFFTLHDTPHWYESRRYKSLHWIIGPYFRWLQLRGVERPTSREANLRQGTSTRNLRGAQQFLLHATVSHESLPNVHSSKLINTVLITTDHDWHSSEGEELDLTHASEDVLQRISNVAQRISLQSPHSSSKRLSRGIDCGQLSIGDTMVDTITVWMDWPAERP